MNVDKNFPVKPEVTEKHDSHYIDKKVLNDEIVKYKQTGVISNKLAEMIHKISSHFARHPQFRYYQFFDIQRELISEGVLMCIKALKSYDPFKEGKSPNPLAYMTEVCKNAFKTYLKKYYGNENFKREMLAEYCYEHGIPFVDVVGNDIAERKAAGLKDDVDVD